MKKLKSLIWLFLFIYFFINLHFIFFESYSIDSVYQFGFCYALLRGEIPYLDYNMIVPPLSTILYSIPLLIKVSYLILNLFQSLLLTGFFYYLIKKYEKKGYLLLSLFACFYPLQFIKMWYSGYCFLLIMEFFLLIYLEEKNNDGFIIGIVLSSVLLTKQTVGLPLLGIPIYYLLKEKRKGINILKGYFILPAICLIYLICTKSLVPFIDQCFLGLFEFLNNNSIISLLSILFIIESFILINRFLKTKNTKYLYLLLYSGCTLPSFDSYHFAIYEFLYIFIFIKDIKIELSKNYLLFFTCIMLSSMSTLYFGLYFGFNLKDKIHSYNHFEYKIENEIDPNDQYMNEYISKYNDKKIIILSYSSFFYKITNNLPIEHYDLMNYGNNGYNGTKNNIDKLKKEKDVYIIIDRIKYPYVFATMQYDTRIINFVVENYTLIEENHNIRIYYKED